MCSPQDALDHMYQMASRLIQGDWFTSRMSACGLIHALYAKLDEGCEERDLLLQCVSNFSVFVLVHWIESELFSRCTQWAVSRHITSQALVRQTSQLLAVQSSSGKHGLLCQ